MAVAWLAGGRLPNGSHATVVNPLSRRTPRRSLEVHRRQLEALLFGVAAVLPDLDLLAGTHSTYTHSLGAVGLAALVTWLLTRGRHPRLVLGVAAAWASHLLLDWLGSDTSPPIGIMALWPFTDGFYQSSLFVFEAISRRYWLPREFLVGNLRAALREVVILGPTALLAFRIRRRTP